VFQSFYSACYISDTFPVGISFVTDQEGAAGGIGGYVMVSTLGSRLVTPLFSSFFPLENRPAPSEILPDGQLRFLFSKDGHPIREILVPDNLPEGELTLEITRVPWSKGILPFSQTSSLSLFREGRKLRAIRITYLHNELSYSVKYE